MTRRQLFPTALAVSGALAAAPRKMTITLSPGSIGVKADQRQAIDYAAKFGFEAVEAQAGAIARLSDDERKALLDDMAAKKVVWGQAGLTVEFRRTEDDLKTGLNDLPRVALALQKAGVTRMTTWLSPGSETLTFRQNFAQHAARLRPIAAILREHGIRFGLEYVGPKTSWTRSRFPFVHSMREMKEMIAEIGTGNVGFVLDSWHWFTAQETAADILTLENKDVVSIDLNDAPAGLPVDQQKDSERELPCATGVIPMADFVNALQKIGCDAPARCEPFNAELRKMAPEQALQTTVNAMQKAFALIKA